MFKPRPSVIIGLLLVVVAGLLVKCQPADQNTAESFLFLNHHDSVNYVGMNVCAQCHTDKHKTFVHTGMGSSFGLANKEKSKASFGDHAVYDSSTNLYYKPFFQNDHLYIMEYEMEGQDTAFKRVEKIDYIIGSGQHTNSHLMLRNGYVVQAPLTYYTQEGTWDLPPGFENGKNARFTRIIDSECMSCHNSIPVLQSGMKRRFAKIGLGIDCERCHGPGELHVKYRQDVQNNASGEFDSTIVNPARLSSELLIDLCQRCHLQGNNVLKKGKQFTDFKPGMKLSDVFEVYLPQYQGDHSEFNMADHSQRLQMSACYGSSQGELTCINCHNPHVSVTRTKVEQFNAVCASCHQEKGCELPVHERAASNNSCVSCHMPLSNSKDIPHVEIHDHKIQIPQDSIKQMDSKLIGLYAVNNPSPEETTLIRAYLSYYEKFDPNPLYLKKAEQLLANSPTQESSIHLLYLRSDWNGIVKLAQGEETNKIDDPFTAYRIAWAFGKSKDYVKAELFMLRAIELEADRFEFLDELGNIYLKQKKLDKAIATFEKSIKWYPFNPKSYNNLAYCLFLKSDFTQAKVYYDKALELNHHYIPALENMANLYLQLNQVEKAKQYIHKALKYTNDSSKLLELLKVIEENE